MQICDPRRQIFKPQILSFAMFVAVFAFATGCGSDSNSASSETEPPVPDTATWGVPWNARTSYGAIRDERDGQVYRTLKIGSRTWMAQNLALAIPGSHCPVGAIDTCRKYGRLYTWSQAMGLDRFFDASVWAGSLARAGICPSGWHLPSDAEWTALLESTGSKENSVQGTVLAGSGAWKGGAAAHVPPNDSLGFRLLPAGEVADDSIYLDRGITGYLWSSTEVDSTQASSVNVNIEAWSAIFGRSSASKRLFRSVRCVED